MDATAHYGDRRDTGRDTNDEGRLPVDMEVSAHALLAVDNAHVEQAMDSVAWERRGLLQRLTRRAR
jgi:hypothetical protein